MFELPIPSHLVNCLFPIGQDNTEYHVTGIIKCECGNELFQVCESNEKQLVKLICCECGKEIKLFDAGKDGWNGFVCKMDFIDRNMPFNKVICSECNSSLHNVITTINSQGKQDFYDECVSNDDSFSMDDWVNGFEWIQISLKCDSCQKSEEQWVDLETM